MRAMSIIGGVGITATLAATLALLIAGAQHVALNPGATTPGGGTRINQFVTIFGAVQSFILCSVLIGIALDDLLSRRSISGLLAPILATKVVVFLLLAVLSVSAVDILLHGVRSLRWMFMFDSDVRLLISLLYFLLPVTLAWQTVVVLRGRDASWRTLAAVMLLAVVMALVTVLGLSRA